MLNLINIHFSQFHHNRALWALFDKQKNIITFDRNQEKNEKNNIFLSQLLCTIKEWELSMNNIIYNGLVKIAGSQYLSSSCILLTEESNGYAMWFSNHYQNTELIKYFQHDKNKAIEQAVLKTIELRKEVKRENTNG